MASLVAQLVKNPPAKAEDACLIPDSERLPCRRKWQPTPVFLSEKSQGQRSLVGCNPWGHKESNMAEQLSLHTCTLKFPIECFLLCLPR